MSIPPSLSSREFKPWQQGAKNAASNGPVFMTGRGKPAPILNWQCRSRRRQLGRDADDRDPKCRRFRGEGGVLNPWEPYQSSGRDLLLITESFAGQPSRPTP
jgi:hypothetical protein